jgi:hypothetical protein
MAVLIVVENPKLWSFQIPGAEIVAGREYLTDPRFVDLKRMRVFNLCRTYTYQTVGYYVSLLAAARGHKPMPSVTTLQDLRQSPIVRIVSEDLEASLQRALARIKTDRFVLSIYFGRNLAGRYDRIAQALFNYFPAPLLRAEFVHVDQWRLQSLRPIASSDIPEPHRDFVIRQATRFFERPRVHDPKPPRYEMAILVNPDEIDAPSDEKAIRRFARAGSDSGRRSSARRTSAASPSSTGCSSARPPPSTTTPTASRAARRLRGWSSSTTPSRSSAARTRSTRPSSSSGTASRVRRRWSCTRTTPSRSCPRSACPSSSSARTARSRPAS